jgi:hypothetical protein
MAAMAAAGSNATIRQVCSDVRFSNRPFRVKRFQTIHDSGVDVAHGLALLFGLGTKALPSWDSKTRWNNLWRDLAVEVTAVQADIRTHLIHRPARDITPPLGGSQVFSYLI